MKIFVLSLPDDIKRRQKISEMISITGCDFSFQDGVDGRVNKIEKDLLSKLSNTEAACALGHIKIYKKIIEENMDYALILEDDVEVDFNSINCLKDIIKSINLDTPMVVLLGGQEGVDEHKYFVGRKIKSFGRVDLYEDFHSAKYLYRTCCYLINKKAAERIVQLNEGLLFVADAWDKFKVNRVINNLYLIDPPIFIHPLDLSNSYIENERKERLTLRKSNFLINFLKMLKINILLKKLLFKVKKHVINFI